MQEEKERSFDELLIRAGRALEVPRLIEIAEISRSPKAAYDLAIMEKFNGEEALSCRYLRIMKKRFPRKFKKMVSKKNRRGCSRTHAGSYPFEAGTKP